MAAISTGSSTAGKANVDSAFNLNVVTPQTEDKAGFVQVSSEVDAGTVTGSRTLRAIDTSIDFRLRAGLDVPSFQVSFEGTTIPQAHIQQNLTTMTAAQASGFLSLNSSNATASGNAANIRTYKYFPTFLSYPLYFDIIMREANETATNAIGEWGLGLVSGTAAPTDGVFFRRESGGQLRGVINFAGTETTTAITTTNVPARDGSGTYSASEGNHYLIVLHNDVAEFWINDVLVGKIDAPAAQPNLTAASSLPVFARVYNSGVASAGRRIEVGNFSVTAADMGPAKHWHHMIASWGGGSIQNQIGSASGQTANWTNSTAPVSATLSNTAAGYTTLGGQWQAAAAAGAETDYALFGYQVPTGTNALPGKALHITGLRIGETFVQGAAVGTSTIFIWGVAVGSTAVSLATADAAATVGPRRKMVGAQALAAAAAVGTLAPGFERQFETPLVAPPGTFVHIILRMPQGAATASLIFRGSVDINGYFE